MAPELSELHVPDGYTVQQRPVCTARIDELPTIRDGQGRVLAQVESWRPDFSVN